MLACLLIVFLSVITCEGGSSKKGVCIPPGTNFHCGDLAAFNNTRKVNFGCVGKQVKISIFNNVMSINDLLLAISNMNIAQLQLVV